ncbi:alpha amylase, catalytic domain-containing protein [Ditylenchus destructor]|uniref:alpha-glucosidase n=1 Tax=Ditylenchus destructor TaxID=166010 RepID=A0AAD4NHP3_9BILA|nr:alpha amylase, catalytic domain-containing protein [Ditylenchus destructor]
MIHVDTPDETESDSLYRIDRGHKTDSYIFAVENNTILIQPRPQKELGDSDAELFSIGRQPRKILNLEQLAAYKDDPFWRRLRWVLCIIFWIVWLLLFAITFFIVLSSPKCEKIVDTKWWKTSIFYEIWTSSFTDSNGDDYGDLLGVQSRLHELKRMGVTALFLRQFLDTEESGIGAQNFVDIEQGIGTMRQAEELIKNAHQEELRVVIDFPIIVTTARHKWFLRSSAASLPEWADYASFYHWKRNVQPSDYVSQHANSSIFYFHFKDRPDLPVLNWNSHNVSTALKKALSFWIAKGVDGFHLSSIEYLHRTPDLLYPDWDRIVIALDDIQSHIKDALKGSLSAADKIFLFASPENIREQHKRQIIAQGHLDSVVNIELTKIALKNKICYESENTVAGCTNEIISDLLLFHSTNRGEMVQPMWTVDNSFTSRLATRIGSRRHAELVTMMQLMLPGANIIYYGQERGLKDISKNADTHDFPGSSKFFKRLARLRANDETLTTGHTYISKVFDNAFALCRYITDEAGNYNKVLVTIANFGSKSVNQSLLDLPPFRGRVRSHNLARYGNIIAITSATRNYCHNQKITINNGQVYLDSDEGIVFRLL